MLPWDLLHCGLSLLLEGGCGACSQWAEISVCKAWFDGGANILRHVWCCIHVCFSLVSSAVSFSNFLNVVGNNSKNYKAHKILPANVGDITTWKPIISSLPPNRELIKFHFYSSKENNVILYTDSRKHF